MQKSCCKSRSAQQILDCEPFSAEPSDAPLVRAPLVFSLTALHERNWRVWPRGEASAEPLKEPPMAPSLFDEAAVASGVSRERASVAKSLTPSIFARHGEAFFAALAAAFYSRVYGDAKFRGLFANTTREAAERNQREFLQQEFGDGRELYKCRKGATALIGRHAPYPVFASGATVWLRYMEDALREVEVAGLCSAEVRLALTDYFRFTAQYIVCGRELVNPERTVGYYGKHTEGHA